jgi:hypothetical protein
MAEHDEDPWTERIRQQLEHSTRDLDAATLSRLNQARQAALQAAPRPKPRPWLWPASLATACTLALAVAIWPRLLPPAVVPPAAATAPEDFPILAGEEQLDLYQDLDFYAWLDAQSSSGPG